MKKYSWIFALILALTMAFVFTACPGDTDDDETKKEEENPPPGPPNPPPAGPGNLIAADGSIKFGATAVEVLPGNNGSIAYTANGAGYKFTFGTVADSNYGNAIVRFKVDLGDKTLGDYGKVSFKWQAHGYKQADVTSNKRLYLLSSVSGTAIEPYQSDAAVKALVISTDVFVDAPSTNFWASTEGVPMVNGTAVHNIEMPIVLGKDSVGDVWFSVHLHASPTYTFYSDKAEYTISDFKFILAPCEPAVSDEPGDDAEDAPPDPLPEGALPFNFNVDLSKNATVGTDAVAGGTVTGVNKTYADGVITAKFSTNGERLIFDLTEPQVEALKNRNGKDVSFTIDGEYTSGSGNFRYHIGNALSGSGWNATTGAEGSFDDETGGILNSDQSFNDNATGAGLNYFILQYRGTTGVDTEIKIRSISIYTTPLKVTFADGDVKGASATITFIDANGFSVVQTDQYDSAYAYFKLTFPEGKKLSDYTKFECKYTLLNTSYKPIYVLAYSTEPTGAVNKDTQTIAKSTGNAATDQDKEALVSLVISGDRVEEVDGNEVWIVINANAANGNSYKITDIKFY
jgi:hypothetical protein